MDVTLPVLIRAATGADRGDMGGLSAYGRVNALMGGGHYPVPADDGPRSGPGSRRRYDPDLAFWICFGDALQGSARPWAMSARSCAPCSRS
jgi:hypothetical protein